MTKFKSAHGLAQWVCKEAALFRDEESPFRASCTKGSYKLVIVTGENASGKSLFARIVGVLCNQQEAVPVSISIRERTGGDHEMAGLRRVMMFGEEKEQSTGATSLSVLSRSFKNIDKPSLLILDEPELGLSEAYTQALGEYIGQKTLDIPKACLGVMVVTHSRPLVRGILTGYGSTPSHVLCTPKHERGKANLNDWLEREEWRSMSDLLMLEATGHERWLAVNKLIKS